MINMLNRNMPLDLQNLINKRCCVSGYLRLIGGHFLVHPNRLTPFHNYWLTDKCCLESVCWIGFGSIVIEQELSDMVSS